LMASSFVEPVEVGGADIAIEWGRMTRMRGEVVMDGDRDWRRIFSLKAPLSRRTSDSVLAG
jgi:hypothetical protein